MQTITQRRKSRIISFVMGCFVLTTPVSAQLPRLILNEVYVDFAVGVDNPLIKTKFNGYDPAGPTMEQFDQNVKIMHELNIETYRILTGWKAETGRRISQSRYFQLDMCISNSYL